MHTPTMELGMKWPSLKRSDLDEIDVLIQIEDLRKMHENRFSKNLGYAVGRLHYDSATRDLHCNAQCDHFDFQIPHYKPQEELGSADKSDHLMSLKDAFAKNRCLKCAHCNSHSQPCLRPSLTLAARVVFRHSNSGRMAHILFDTLPLASGENGNDPVGSYSILFQTTLNFTFFGTVSANLEFRLFSEERKDINSFTSVRVRSQTHPRVTHRYQVSLRIVKWDDPTSCPVYCFVCGQRKEKKKTPPLAMRTPLSEGYRPPKVSSLHYATFFGVSSLSERHMP